MENVKLHNYYLQFSHLYTRLPQPETAKVIFMVFVIKGVIYSLQPMLFSLQSEAFFLVKAVQDRLESHKNLFKILPVR